MVRRLRFEEADHDRRDIVVFGNIAGDRVLVALPEEELGEAIAREDEVADTVKTHLVFLELDLLHCRERVVLELDLFNAVASGTDEVEARDGT